MLTQLDPPIPLEVLDKGKGLALAVIDYGAEHHLIWVTAIDATGEIWCAPNPQVRIQNNWTMGRRAPSMKGAPQPAPIVQSPIDATAPGAAGAAPVAETPVEPC